MLALDALDLEALFIAAQKYGVSSFKNGSMEIVFHRSEQPRMMVATSEVQKQPIGATYGMPTEDELLFASSIPLTEDEIKARAP